MVVVLGVNLCGIEAAMTHQGLAWLDARKDLAPDWALWIAWLGLSVFNVFSLYTFARDLKRREKPETMAGKLLAMKSVQARPSLAGDQCVLHSSAISITMTAANFFGG